MGQILIAKCACGFVSQELFVGEGMARASYFSVPAYCSNCQLIFTVKHSAPNPKCKNCGNDVTPYKHKDFEFPTDAKYPCPRCKQESLRFEDTGIWD